LFFYFPDAPPTPPSLSASLKRTHEAEKLQPGDDASFEDDLKLKALINESAETSKFLNTCNVERDAKLENGHCNEKISDNI
jgi:uncharacterized cupin superfamily protein